MNCFETLYIDFKSSLNEVNLFLEFSEEREKSKEKETKEGNLTEAGIKKYNDIISLYNRSATLFLASKFETFIEDLISKYAIEMQKINLPSTVIPDSIRNHCVDRLIDKDFIDSIISKRYDVARLDLQIETLGKVKDLFDPNKKVKELPIDSKFNYGKHGIFDIINLFRRIGIEDVFKECPVYRKEENLLGADAEVKVNVTDSLNNLIKARNEIIHRNEIPDLSRYQIEKFKNDILLFYEKITQVLQVRISGFEIHSSTQQ